MIKTILDLGTQPLVNNLCNSEQEAMEAEQFPLRAIVEEDLTIHLDYAVDPEILYKHYLYRSGVSQPYVDHCEAMYKSLSHLNLSTVVDIGGNDGTLLNTFRQTAIGHDFWSGTKPERFINVDMGHNFKEVNEEAGNEFVCGQFNEHMDLPKANLIVSTNVFQHTKDIHAFMRGIVKFLDGVWVLEFPYTLDTITTGQFDQFYHEHYYYWLMAPLEELFNQYGLRIIAYLPQTIHGGTMRLWMTNKEMGPPALNLSAIKEKEQKAVERCNFDQTIAELRNYFGNVLSTGELGRICFFGAAAKGCVFLNALGLNINTMGETVVVDDTVEKQGLYVPGTGFQVVDRSALKDYDTVIILAHNFADHIEASLRKEFDGRIMTLLPIKNDK
jgi:hypothetical protein